MYARLVVQSTNTTSTLTSCIRDICRLVTSASPSTANIGSYGYDAASSVVLDATPAGWTYVGGTSASDRPSIAAGTTQTAFSSSTVFTMAIKAPMADYPTRWKYAALTQTSTASSGGYNYTGALLGCVSATSAAALTSPSVYEQSGTGSTDLLTYSCPAFTAGAVHHLIATPRGIVIVQEGAGFCGVVEMTTSDVNNFYGTAAFAAFWNPAGGTSSTTLTGPNALGNVFGVQTFDVTDPNNATYYGVYDSTVGGTTNGSNAYQNTAVRAMTQDASGMPQYMVSPVYIHNHLIGHPVQYVTGVFPMYWCKSSLGSTGDTVLIGTDEYTYFHCGANTAGYGLLMKTN